MTPQDRITRSHIAIMRSKEFCMFSGVLSVGDIEFSDKVPTAGTNGVNVVYNPEYIKDLSDKELNFLVLHEAIHKAFQHLHMWKKLFKQNPQVANMAADYIVNQNIKNADLNEDFAKMPQGGLYDIRFENWTTKQVFDKLLKENPNMQQQYQLDVHDWEDADKMSDDEVNEVKKQIDTALRQGEILRGKLNGNTHRGVNEILKPKINWREQLREYMNAVCRTKDKSSWRRPSRRYISQDIYMPSMIGESIGDIVLAIDTSGSIQEKEIQTFVSELIAICHDVQPRNVHLIYWDHDVQAVEKYDATTFDMIAKSTKPRGGGGTRVGCVNKYIQDNKLNPETAIIFTDGYVEEDWGGSWKHPTLWVVTSNQVSPHGKTLTFEGE